MQRSEAIAELKRLRRALEQNVLNHGNMYVLFADDQLHEYWRNCSGVQIYYVDETAKGSGDYVIKKRYEP
jgi:hypothetical protein